MKRFAVIVAGLALLAPMNGALAQFSPGARSVGMGGAGMVYSSGVDAIEWNPANLGLDGGWNVSIYELGTSALVSGATLDGLGTMFEFKLGKWGSSGPTTAEQQEALDDLPSSGLTLSTMTDGFVTAKGIDESDGALPSPGDPFPSVGITVGPFGLRIRSRVMGEMRLSRELVDLIVTDFDPARINEYQVGNTGFRTTTFSEVTAAYGTRLGERMALGVGVRYVKGHKLTEGRFFEPVLDLVNETAEFNSVAIEAPGGSGYGVDVGLALDLALGLRVSASATNVIQKMTWDDDLIAHEATFFACDCPQSDFESGDPETLIDMYQASPVDPASMSLYVAETVQGLFPGAFFPTVFRLGAGWRPWSSTSFELVGTSVSPRGRQHEQWDERISLGVEQRLWIFTLRAGGAKATDGLQVLSGGLGLGLGPVKLDVSGGVMSGGFDLTSGVVASEDVDYAGGHVTASLQISGGGG